LESRSSKVLSWSRIDISTSLYQGVHNLKMASSSRSLKGRSFSIWIWSRIYIDFCLYQCFHSL
jgi:hypothetical protein